ncbi:unnamed protein product [Choristocarpus tenellus]
MSTPGGEGEGEFPFDPLPRIDASELVRRVVDRAFHDVRHLAHTLNRVNLNARREDLLTYVRLCRARFLKTYVAIRWLSDCHGGIVVKARDVLVEGQSQRDHIDTCQDQFFFMHGGLFGARQRLYDVPAAVDVLAGGKYPRLPKGIEYCGGDTEPQPHTELSTGKSKVISLVERAIRQSLLRRESLPSYFTSHSLRGGVLTLVVQGEFELLVTLEGEEDGAPWVLLGVHINIHARKGEAVAEPPSDWRQQRYLHEVVQKVMYRYNETSISTGPLLAAYCLCHDFCAGIVLEVLCAQAQALSTRMGGLWANQLQTRYYKKAQVLDLYIWQKEYSTGLGGTGRDIGVGGQIDFSTVQGDSVDVEHTEWDCDLPAPQGCRYLRIYRSQGKEGKVLVKLGPVNDLLTTTESSSLERSNQVKRDDCKPRVKNRMSNFISGAVMVKPDELSCSDVLLSAVRIFAAAKIQTLAEELKKTAQDICLRGQRPQIRVVGEFTVQVCPREMGCVEVSLDVQSGRYLVHRGNCINPSLERCLSRLQEALNLLPDTGKLGMGANITATLAAARVTMRSKESANGGASALGAAEGSNQRIMGAEALVGYQEQRDLRESQVRRFLREAFGLLLLEEVDKVLCQRYGLVSHHRWQVLIDREVRPPSGDKENHQGDGISSRTLTSLHQFREVGVNDLKPPFMGQSNTWGSDCRPLELGGGGSWGMSMSPMLSETDLGEKTISVGGTVSKNRAMSFGALDPTAAKGDVRVGETLTFFVEFSVTANLDVEAILIATASPTETNDIVPRSVVPAVVARHEVASFRNLPHTIQASGSNSILEAGDGSVTLGKRASTPGELSGLECHQRTANGNHRGKRLALSGNRETKQVMPSIFCTPSAETSVAVSTEEEIDSILQSCHCLIPLVRLERALARLGSRVSLKRSSLPEFNGANQFLVLMPRPATWSAFPLLVETVEVKCLSSHDHLHTWEWHLHLGAGSHIFNERKTEAVRARHVAVAATDAQIHFPLLSGITIKKHKARRMEVSDANEEGNEMAPHRLDAIPGEQRGIITLVFPRCFSVYSMCMSMEFAGEGLCAMLSLTEQATDLPNLLPNNAGYRVVASSVLHVSLCHITTGHVILVSHSAFSADHMCSGQPPGVVVIPSSSVPTCPVAILEVQSMLRKQMNLKDFVLLVSKMVPPLAELASVIPGVGCGVGAAPVHDQNGFSGVDFLLTAQSPVSYTLTYTHESLAPNPTEGLGRGGALLPNGGAVKIDLGEGGLVTVSDSGIEECLSDAMGLRIFSLKLASRLKQSKGSFVSVT